METIILKKGGWEAEIVPSYAMNVIRLTYCGEPVLRAPDAPEALDANHFVYGTPFLFPPNVTAGDTFTFEGKTYVLPYPETGGRRHQHGLLYNADMKIVEKRADYLRGVFLSGTDRYPFPFRLTISCELADDGLTQRFAIENTGERNMAYLLGLHTTFAAKPVFAVSLKNGWTREEGSPMPVAPRPLTEEEQRYVTGTSPSGRNIHGQFTDNGAHLATVGDFGYRLSDNFTTWVLWNKGGNEGFISLEPQSGSIDGLNREGQYNVLTPGKTEIFETKIFAKQPKKEEKYATRN